MGCNHAEQVRKEIRHLIDDGRLTETRTARAKILTVSRDGVPRPGQASARPVSAL